MNEQNQKLIVVEEITKQEVFCTIGDMSCSGDIETQEGRLLSATMGFIRENEVVGTFMVNESFVSLAVSDKHVEQMPEIAANVLSFINQFK